MKIERHMTFDSWAECEDWLSRGGEDRQIPLPLQAQAPQRPAPVAEADTAPDPASPDPGPAPIPPTSAVVSELERLAIPPNVWPDIPRTGKEGRMTKADVTAWAKARPAASAPARQPEPTPEPAPEPEPTPEPAPELTSDAPMLDQARGALKALNNTRGMPPCIEALKKFGARRVSEIDPEQFGEFIAYCDLQRDAGRASA